MKTNVSSMLLRLTLIAVIALFAGPRPAIAVTAGVEVVICGADGAARTVVYDFDTGAPVEPVVGMETCDDCVAAKPFVTSAGVTEPFRIDALERARSDDNPQAPRAQSGLAKARAPPQEAKT